MHIVSRPEQVDLGLQRLRAARARETIRPAVIEPGIARRRGQRRGLRLIGYAFAALAVYLLVQSTLVLDSFFAGA
jgi:hypothetical protein